MIDLSTLYDKVSITSNTVLVSTGIVLLAILIHLYHTYWRLSHIPGPFWAKITNFQRVYWVKTKRAHRIHYDLHDKYGEFVRFGPNMVSISDPAAIPIVYPMRAGIPKGLFYRTLMPYTRKGGALPAVFNTRDEKLHKQIKNPIAPLFSLSNVITYEPFVDKVLAVMFEQINARCVKPKEYVDFGLWLQFFAFDVMGTLTFSKRYGFLETGKDVDGMLATIWTYMTTAAPMTQIPWLDEFWYKNRYTALLRKTTGFSILSIVGKFISQRLEQVKGAGVESEDEVNKKDMLSRFIHITQTNPAVPKWVVTAWTFSNVIAGSDSTGVVLRTIWYNLLAHPETLQRLLDELESKDLTRPFPKWEEVRDLPYLDACVQEGVRMHPPFCLPFERVVPESGLTICGRYFPPGTVVGVNPYVVNRHKPTFGNDAESWRPDRWLGKSDEERRRMEGAVLTFGAGRRICLGKYIALLEIKKMVPAILLSYKVQIRDPKEFKVENSWFFRQMGLIAKIEKREQVNS
ncbi:putative cytochrome P450 oxidoreductase [Delitschia confertaspora ATCC 74209]|uniref:Cytochrome P450 oxidoreductase n=1 Tax=Delitschia confertaspora ATCC 74209 TaxID=1513339 RepID=A0A9P4JU22_9PLEO|nr:putative cytochrome P450 oxidoreductase [Delitschia confertaspora ATCC 74209]